MAVPYDIGANVVWQGVQQAVAAIDAVAGGRTSICMVGSGSGVGKTHLARQGCRKYGIKKLTELGPTNEASLVKSYWQHRNEPVLLLDEAEEMWRQPSISKALKRAYGEPRHLIVGTVEASQNERWREQGNKQYDPNVPPPEFLLRDMARGIGLTNTNFSDPRVIEALPAPENFRALVGRGLDPVWVPGDQEHDGLDLFLYTHYLATEQNMLRGRQIRYEAARQAVNFFVANVRHLVDIHPRRLCLIADACTWPHDKRDRRLEGMLRPTDQRPRLHLPRTWVPVLYWPETPPSRQSVPPPTPEPEKTDPQPPAPPQPPPVIAKPEPDAEVEYEIDMEPERYHAIYLPGGSGRQVCNIYTGDCRTVLPTLKPNLFHICVTSPPYYGLRDYGTGVWVGGEASCEHRGDTDYYTERSAASAPSEAFSGTSASNAERLREGWRERGVCRCGAVRFDRQIGLETTPEEYVAQIVAAFREVRRVLRDDGTLWLILGDTYSGGGRGGGRGGDKQSTNVGSLLGPAPPLSVGRKQLLGIPWLVAHALQADGWFLRSDISLNKVNPMPESVKDRPTSSHEHVFLFSKRERYFYDADAIAEPSKNPGPHPTRNARDVWTIAEDCPTDARSDWPPANYHAQIDASDLASEQKVSAHMALEQALAEVDAGILADFRMGIRGVRSPLNGTEEAMGLRQRCLADQGWYIFPIYGVGRTDVWGDITPQRFKGPHYATMPIELPKRCIMAGTSERGCCPQCGAQWRRTKRVSADGERAQKGERYEKQFTGWEPTCACAAGDPVPCKVFDPYAGVGTTGVAAIKLGRDAVLIELNAHYAEIAKERLASECEQAKAREDD